MITFGSLFAGIGGFDLGLERAGMVCKWQVEREPYAVRVLEKHWPEVTRHDDVCTFPPKEGNWEVDLICGGFPCQDISLAGKGAGLAGERSGLWYEFARIIGELRPRYVIVENVSALLSRGMDTVLGDLSTLGYDAEWHVIPASAVGAPHRRDRVWIVGYADSNCQPACSFNAETSKLPSNVAYAVSKRDAVRRDGETMPPAVACGRCDARGSVSDCGAGCSQEPGQCGSDVAYARNRLAGWWETEPRMGRVVDGLPHRVDRLRGLGNAVVPQVVEFIGHRILEIEAVKK